MVVDISKITLENIDDYIELKFKTKKDKLLYKLKQQVYVSNKEMKNISTLIGQIKQEGYKIETIPKVGYRLLNKVEESENNER